MIDRAQIEQSRYLDYCQQRQVEVSIILVSGTHFVGYVVAHDWKTLLLAGKRESNPPRLLSKGYIALIRPNKDEDLDLFLEYRGMGTYLQRKREKKALRKLMAAAGGDTAES